MLDRISDAIGVTPQELPVDNGNAQDVASVNQNPFVGKILKPKQTLPVPVSPLRMKRIVHFLSQPLMMDNEAMSNYAETDLSLQNDFLESLGIFSEVNLVDDFLRRAVVPDAAGTILEMDLFDGFFEYCGWFQTPSCDNDEFSIVLDHLCIPWEYRKNKVIRKGLRWVDDIPYRPESIKAHRAAEFEERRLIELERHKIRDLKDSSVTDNADIT